MASYMSFDPATTTGWATGSRGVIPRAGSFTLGPPGDDFPAFFVRYAAAVDPLLAQFTPSLVFVEQPFIMPTDNWADVYILTGLCTLTEFLCRNRKIPSRRVPAKTWRKAFLGDHFPDLKGLTRPQRRAKLKAAAHYACKLHGWAPRNDDEADALGILHYLVSTESLNAKFRKANG